MSATTDSDNKAASGEGEVPATAASEAEDFAHLAEQLQLDQISKDGNGTETFQVGFSKIIFCVQMAFSKLFRV